LLRAGDPPPADLHLGVEQEERAPGNAVIALEIGAPDAPGVDQLALEVGDQLEGQAAQLLGEGLVRVDAVDADAEDADPGLLELLEVVPKLGKLIPSTGCEVEDVEGDHSRRVALHRLRKAHLSAAGRGQLEIGR
jgi:hypothetical protein